MRKIFPAIIILMLFVTGCSKVDSRFVGMWKSESGTTLTIFPDGTGSHHRLSCTVKTTDDLLLFEDKISKNKQVFSYRVINVTDTSMTLVGVEDTKVFKKL